MKGMTAALEWAFLPINKTLFWQVLQCSIEVIYLRQNRLCLGSSPRYEADPNDNLKIQELIMQANELRALQSPLKNKYREQPETAQITLTARGRIGEGVTCKVETGRALVEAGLHPATGGDGLTVCSGDMLLEALVACAGVTLRAVATSIGVDLKDATVSAEGDLDVRGTLSVSREAPVGFKNIRLHFDLDSSAPQDEVESLVKLTERYCVVYQSLSSPANMTVAYQIGAEGWYLRFWMEGWLPTNGAALNYKLIRQMPDKQLSLQILSLRSIYRNPIRVSVLHGFSIHARSSDVAEEPLEHNCW
jgi:uncharacterized OsmC-like protein